MNSTGDFHILEVLNPKSKADLLLIKKVATNELFVCKAVSTGNISKEKRDILGNEIRRVIQQEHPLLVKFYPGIKDEMLKMIYIPMEYFPFGNLAEFLKKIEKSNLTHMNEEVIVKILFQLLILLKSINMYNFITAKKIYFDKYFNVKVLNFSMFSNPTKYDIKKCDIKMCDIGNIILQLCTLNTARMCNKYIVNNEYYSKEFIDLIEIMLSDTKNVKINIDKILCHPVILMNTFKLIPDMKLAGCFEILDYRTKLENLCKREVILKAKEQKIENKELSLNLREKKVTICEKELKSKLLKAELYLKRSKARKPAQSHKYKANDNSGDYEELECFDVEETSRKMNLDNLKSIFTRTFSEKRVRFKGHSPLKEMDFHKSKSMGKSKANLELFKDQCKERKKFKNGTIESTNIKDLIMEKSFPVKKEENKQRTSVFSAKTLQLQVENERNMNCLPIAWTEESKKQAFDLLRIMNSTVDKHILTGDVKHTYL